LNRLQPRKRIWLVGGTAESAQLANVIAQANLPCTVSVTTAAAKSLYPEAPELQVLVGKFNLEQLEQFLQAENIVAVLDASHPYAVEISKLAIAAGERLQIPYLRFERPELEIDVPPHGPVTTLDSFDTLLAKAYLQGRVLLTIGYKPLSLFTAWQNEATLFARILPSQAALEAALAAKFSAERLFAMRPPVPQEIERALWQHWQISTVVTKASGQPGGEDSKRAIAAELGVKLIVIQRPQLFYSQQTSDLAVALAFCCQHVSIQDLNRSQFR